MDKVRGALRGGRMMLAGKAQGPMDIVPPNLDSSDYDQRLASLAARILYQNPLPAENGKRLYIVNHFAFKTVNPADFDALLPYIVSRFPTEEELINGLAYEIIIFAGDGTSPEAKSEAKPEAKSDAKLEGDNINPTSTTTNPTGPSISPTPKDGSTDESASGKPSSSWMWLHRAHKSLPRILRKRVAKVYIVHESSSNRMVTEMFITSLSIKFRKKMVHVSSLTALAQIMKIENLLIPPTTYFQDRTVSEAIKSPHTRGKRAFGIYCPLPVDVHLRYRLPRVLRETTQFLLMGSNLGLEGILRIPGSIKLRDILREAYDRGQKFILWKEGDTAWPCPAIDGAILPVNEEIDSKDAYGVIIAGSLIKYWYYTLKDPVFPPSSYPALRAIGSKVVEIDTRLKELVELFGPNSDQSPLPVNSREILCRHLLPFMAMVAKFQDANRMSPANLAVCIGPSLIRGTDPMEDMGILGMIQPILTQAIENWSGEGKLGDMCGFGHDVFLLDLMAPDDLEEYEDPEDEEEEVFASTTVPDKAPQNPATGPSPIKRKNVPTGMSLPSFPKGFLSALSGSSSNNPNPSVNAGGGTSGASTQMRIPNIKSPSGPTSPTSPDSVTVTNPDQSRRTRNRGNSLSSAEAAGPRSVIFPFLSTPPKPPVESTTAVSTQRPDHLSPHGNPVNPNSSMDYEGPLPPMMPGVSSSNSKSTGLSRSTSVNLPPNQKGVLTRKPLPPLGTGFLDRKGTHGLDISSVTEPVRRDLQTPSPTSDVVLTPSKGAIASNLTPTSPLDPFDMMGPPPTYDQAMSTHMPKPICRSDSVSGPSLPPRPIIPAILQHKEAAHQPTSASQLLVAAHRRTRSVAEAKNTAWYDPTVSSRKGSAVIPLQTTVTSMDGGKTLVSAITVGRDTGSDSSPLFNLPSSMSSALPDPASSVTSVTSFTSRSATVMKGHTQNLFRRVQRQVEGHVDDNKHIDSNRPESSTRDIYRRSTDGQSVQPGRDRLGVLEHRTSEPELGFPEVAHVQIVGDEQARANMARNSHVRSKLDQYGSPGPEIDRYQSPGLDADQYESSPTPESDPYEALRHEAYRKKPSGRPMGVRYKSPSLNYDDGAPSESSSLDDDTYESLYRGVDPYHGINPSQSPRLKVDRYEPACSGDGRQEPAHLNKMHHYEHVRSEVRHHSRVRSDGTRRALPHPKMVQPPEETRQDISYPTMFRPKGTQLDISRPKMVPSEQTQLDSSPPAVVQAEVAHKEHVSSKETRRNNSRHRIVEPEVASQQDLVRSEETRWDISRPKIVQPKGTRLDISFPEIVQPPEDTQRDISCPTMFQPKGTQLDIYPCNIAQPKGAQLDISHPKIAQSEETQRDISRSKMTQPMGTQPDISYPKMFQQLPAGTRLDIFGPQVAQPARALKEHVRPEEIHHQISHSKTGGPKSESPPTEDDSYIIYPSTQEASQESFGSSVLSTESVASHEDPDMMYHQFMSEGSAANVTAGKSSARMEIMRQELAKQLAGDDPESHKSKKMPVVYGSKLQRYLG